MLPSSDIDNFLGPLSLNETLLYQFVINACQWWQIFTWQRYMQVHGHNKADCFNVAIQLSTPNWCMLCLLLIVSIVTKCMNGICYISILFWAAAQQHVCIANNLKVLNFTALGKWFRIAAASYMCAVHHPFIHLCNETTTYLPVWTSNQAVCKYQASVSSEPQFVFWPLNCQ